MAPTEAPAYVLDCRGELCPIPVIKTAQAIRNVESGQILELLATDPGVEPDMRAWTTRTGNALVDMRRDGDVVHVYVRKA